MFTHTHTHTKEHKETLGGDGYVYFLDGGDGIIVYAYVHT